MHQRETGSKIQASGASNAGTFSKLWNFTNPFCEKFRGEMQMSFRGGSEQNYENNNVSPTIQNKTNFKTS